MREQVIFSSAGVDLIKTIACAHTMHINCILQAGYGRVDGRPRAQARELAQVPGSAFVLHAILTAVPILPSLFFLIAQLKSICAGVAIMYSVLESRLIQIVVSDKTHM